MNNITEKSRFCKRVVEYAVKENSNAKAARRYETTRQQVKSWRDKYDGTVKSLVYKSKRPKSHPNQHTEQEIELIMKKYKKYGFEGMAEVYVQAQNEGYSRSYDSMCKKIRQIRDNKVVVKKKKYKLKLNVEKVKYPGEKVQIDIKYIPKECIKFVLKDKNYYQITVIDEYTRKRVLAVIDEKSTYQTANF